MKIEKGCNRGFYHVHVALLSFQKRPEISMNKILANHTLFPMFNFVSSTLSLYPCIQFSISRSTSTNFSSIGSFINPKNLVNSIKVSQKDEHEFYDELQFKEREKMGIELEMGRNGEEEVKMKTNILEFDENLEREDVGRLKEEDLVTLEELEKTSNGVQVLRRGKQVMKRSSMIAKQVISIQSALSLGFVSQLWVDAHKWMVVIVEVRPNLLSGELERFLLEDTSQVGDVVLIPDENVMENEFKMVGLETLVGYNVVTPGRRNIGKVRGYTFNINSGAIESLELDSFGISIIPSSFVSTYALFVEDVLEVVADTVVVHEAAASRIQRLTKGFWDGRRVDYSMDDLEEYSDLERQPSQSDYGKSRRRRKSTGQKPGPRIGEDMDDWELPMDYL